MKAAIITLAFETSYTTNYGNRLQNFALQELLKSQGIVAETILHKNIHGRSFFGRMLVGIKDVAKRLLRYDRQRRIRHRAFDRFDQRYITWGKQSFHFNQVPASLASLYDHFVVGSDQVWNTYSSDVRERVHIFTAAFAKPEQRIAYAASFGRPDIAPECQTCFSDELKKFKALSVREKQGLALAKQCGASATLVLDPTMMLSCDAWDAIAEQPAGFSGEPYIVTYFLGGRTEAMDEYIRSVAGGRTVIHLVADFISTEEINRSPYYTASPGEFVWLIAHAEAVLTDSFHASVFSILYHKPFLVFDRLVAGKEGKMGSRIETLLSTFHIEQCSGDFSDLSKPVPHDVAWDEVEAILLEERKKSLAFLSDALS